jgi:VWFA-related protein
MQDFTSNRALALKAIDASMGNKADSSTQAALQDYYQNRDSPGVVSNNNASFNELQRYDNARNSVRTLKGLADFMAGMRGRRKAVVFFSEGVNYDITNPIANPHATDVQHEIRDLVAAATRANVNVYTVDPRGVTSGMEDAIEIGGLPADNSISMVSLMDEMRLEQDSLRVIADETGGFAVLNQNDFRNAFSRILEDNSSYYVLGYYPTNEKLDGRFRNVQVKILKPGLKVRFRKGYVAPVPPKKEKPAKGSPEERTSPALRDALDSPIAISGLTISAFAAPFKGAGANVAIALAIEVDGSTLTFAQNAQGLFTDNLEISLFAADASGKIKDGARDVIGLSLKPQTHDLVARAFPDHPPAADSARQVPAPRRRARIERRESRHGDLRPRRTRLLEGEPDDERHRARVRVGQPVSDRQPGPERERVQGRAPLAAQRVARVPAPGHASPSSRRSTTTPSRPRIASKSPRPCWPTTAVVHTTSDVRKSEELQGRRGYGYTRRFRSWIALGPLRAAPDGDVAAGQTGARHARRRIPRAMSLLTTIARGDGSHVTEPRRATAGTEPEWRALWATHAGPGAEAPALDLSAVTVAAAFAGEKPSAGHSIEITAAEPAGPAGVTLVVDERGPGPGMVSAAIITSPFHIVAVPKGTDVTWGPGIGDQGSGIGRAGIGKNSAISPEPRSPIPDPRSPTASSTGLEPRTAAALAYFAGPFSGALILATESTNDDVRFHAWQSIVGLGGLGLAVVISYVLALLAVFVSATVVSLMLGVAAVIWIVLGLVWLICLWKAWSGGRWKLPLAGDYAERFVNGA